MVMPGGRGETRTTPGMMYFGEWLWVDCDGVPGFRQCF